MEITTENNSSRILQQIKEGYKKTAVGIIPEDWEVKKLSSQVYVDKENINSKFDKEFINYVSLSDIGNGKILPQKIKYKIAPSRAKRITEKGDVLLATVRPNLKNFAIVDRENIIASTGFAVLSHKKMNLKYLYNFLFSQNAEKQFYTLTVGSNYPALNSNDVKNLKLPIPPLPEQKAIADCLTTWDKGIEKLSALITAKKEQKKGLMQQLLTGKKRLDGFEEEWKAYKLSEVAELKHGYQFRKTDFVDKGIPVIKIGNVEGQNLNMQNITYVDVGRREEFKKFLIKNGDLLMSLTGNIGRVVEVKNLTKDLLQNYRVGNFHPLVKLILRPYLKYLLSSESLFNQFNNLANQSAQANFGKMDMDKLKVRIPKCQKEQIAIADVLNTADKEIELLEKKLETFKTQKKGLMQVLLTGALRLCSGTNGLVEN